MLAFKQKKNIKKNEQIYIYFQLLYLFLQIHFKMRMFIDIVLGQNKNEFLKENLYVGSLFTFILHLIILKTVPLFEQRKNTQVWNETDLNVATGSR